MISSVGNCGASNNGVFKIDKKRKSEEPLSNPEMFKSIQQKIVQMIVVIMDFVIMVL